MGFAVSCVGFVTVFVRIGSLKGKFTEKIQNIEVRMDETEKDVDLLSREVRGMDKEITGVLSEIKATNHYIKETLTRLERKLDGGKN